MDAFEKNIDEKSQYIDKIVFLDDGFEEIYTRVKRRTGWKQSCIYGRDSEDERSDLYDHRTQHEDPGSGAAQQRACRNAVLKGTEKRYVRSKPATKLPHSIIRICSRWTQSLRSFWTRKSRKIKGEMRL